MNEIAGLPGAAPHLGNDMERDEYIRTCVERAHAEDMQYEHMRPGFWHVVTKRGSEYDVVWDAFKGEYACACESYEHRGFCKHVAGLHVAMTRAGVVETLPRHEVVVNLGSVEST
jgi:hypothetical protein